MALRATWRAEEAQCHLGAGFSPPAAERAEARRRLKVCPSSGIKVLLICQRKVKSIGL
jgi:hypothetical protein